MATTTDLGRVTGKSAYEVWKSLGNNGTEQDFINSLKGAKGDPGAKGDGIINVSTNGTTNIIKFNGLCIVTGYGEVPSGAQYVDIPFPFVMADNNYTPIVTKYQNNRDGDMFVMYVTTSNMRVYVDSQDTSQKQNFYYTVIGRY